MSQDYVERLLGRLVTDDNFREQIKSEFNKVCFQCGFVLSEDEKHYLQMLDFEKFTPLAKILNGALKRSTN